MGPRLERLEICASSPSIYQSISSYWMQLRELHVEEAYKSGADRSDLWKKVGGTLEKLTVHFMFSASTEIRIIQQQCRKIRWIHITDWEPVSPAVAGCIVSYGEQLEYAFLEDMSQGQLEPIITAFRMPSST